MKKLALACCLLAVSAFAEGEAGWKPRHVSAKPDKKGIDAMYKAMEEAMKAGKVEEAAAMVDFPVMMMTDTAAGVPSTVMWDKATWMKTMTDSAANMPKDMKMGKKTKITFLTDSLAFVEEDNDMTMGKTKDKWVSGAIVELKDGKWMAKGMIEGGWGDMMPKEGAKTAAAEPAMKKEEPKKADAAKPAPAPAPAK
jgi:hypothetical protein